METFEPSHCVSTCNTTMIWVGVDVPHHCSLVKSDIFLPKICLRLTHNQRKTKRFLIHMALYLEDRNSCNTFSSKKSIFSCRRKYQSHRRNSVPYLGSSTQNSSRIRKFITHKISNIKLSSLKTQQKNISLRYLILIFIP